MKNLLHIIIMISIFVGCVSSKDTIHNTNITYGEHPIVLGIEQISDYKQYFKNKRVGLITNQTGIDKLGRTSIDLLNKHVNLVALFSPEHGIRGNMREGATINHSIDKKTGLPIYSLYGKTRRPTKEMLDSIDVLCFDIQDVGARFYTYISTMAYAMEECATYNKEFIVFDRPNPIGGKIEGNILEKEFRSFVGLYPIVQRHGMTIGELALMFNNEFHIGCKLNVIPLKHWNRNDFFDALNLMWIPPSPNIPKSSTALIYVGMCIFEGVNLSVGRGTTMPFEYIGSPYIDPELLSQSLNDLKLDGVFFYPAYFIPKSSLYANTLCNGVQIIITNQDDFDPVKTGIIMFDVIKQMYPMDFKINDSASRTCGLNLLTGTSVLTDDDCNIKKLLNKIDLDSMKFQEQVKKYLLY